MEFLSQYGLFLLKTVTAVIAILITLVGILALTNKSKPRLEISALNKERNEVMHLMTKVVGGVKPKKYKKVTQPAVYVLNFDGDITASQVKALREEITAILSIAEPKKDEVLVKLKSPGGSVSGYGLAAAQLQRLRDKHLKLTVCIDEVAASGGYLMACVANHVIAAPFAIIGSIGVVAQIPNFHRWLKKNDIDVELLTAGEYKRTLTLFAANTEKGRKKFQEDLEKIHKVFRDYVVSNRTNLDMEKVATGEHWLAKDALDLGLVDSLATSDAVLMEKMQHFNVYKIHLHVKTGLLQKLLKPVMSLVHTWY